MVNYLWILAPVAPVLALLAAFKWESLRRERVVERSPVRREKMLRPPGYHLSLKLERLQDRLYGALFVAILPVVLLSAPGGRSIPMTLVAGAISCLASVFAWRTVSEMRNHSAGLRGEQVMAEMLNGLLAHGYFVFHDLQTNACGNIDHVLVGPAGVFVIETKYRRKKKSRSGRSEHEVLVQGDALRWPNRTDRASIPQVRRNAAWLARELESEHGGPVPVAPLLALPGWYVTHSTPPTIPVLNHKCVVGHITRQTPRLTPAQIATLRARLDALCRDVEI